MALAVHEVRSPSSLAARCIAAVASLLLAGGAEAQATDPTLELSAGIHRIQAEIASTFSTRAEGLMHRPSMAASRGMLFVFPEPGRHCMWMRNTLIPLSAAFIDARGQIINVAEMQPQTLTNHCPDQPAAFVLEMNAGWFKSRGLGPGTRVTGLEKAPPGR